MKTLSEKKYRSLKKDVETLERKQMEATGAVDQLKKELRQRFGCKTLEHAKKKLKKLEEQQRAQEEQFNYELKAFNKRFGKLVRAIEEEDPNLYRIAKRVLANSRQGKKRNRKAKKKNR